VTYVWIAAAVLFGIAAVATFWAFQNPAFVAGLTAAAVAAAGRAIWPHLSKMLTASPETNERTKNDSRQAVERTITGREKER